MAESTAQINLKLKDEATKGINSVTTSFGALKTAIKGLAVAVGAVAGVGTAIGLMAAKGEDLRTMRNLFATLAVNAGSSMNEMVAAMNRGAEGLISQTDLMKGSLRVLANTNLPVTAEAMELVAEASKRLGIATGVGAKEAFERFTSAITTGRTRSLAHLGVMVDQTEETENLAKATGRAVSEITFAEEQTAIYNAILRETAGALERAGDFSVGFGGQVDQLKTSIVNFKDELFAFTSAFGDAFIDSFKDATGVQINFGTALKFNAETIANFTRNTLVFLIQGLSALSTAWAFVAEGVNLFLGPLSVLAGLVVKVGKILTTALLAPIQGIISGFEFLIGIIGKAASALGLGGFGGFLKLSSEFIGGFNEDIDGMIAGIDDVSDGLIGMGMESINNIGSAGDSAREFSGTLDDIAGALSEIDASDIATDMAGVATGTGIAAKNIEAISDDLVNIKENSKKAADAWITAFKGGIGAATRDELVATAQLFASELGAELPELGILSFDDLKKIIETLKTGMVEAADATRAKIEAILPPKFGIVGEEEGFKFGETSLDVLQGGASGIVDAMLTAFADSTGLIGQIIVGAIQILKEPGALQAIIQSIFTAVLGAPRFLTDLTLFLVKALPTFIKELIGTMIPELITSLPIIVAELILFTPALALAFVEGMIALFTPSNWVRITAALWPLLQTELQDILFDSIQRPIIAFVDAMQETFDFLSAKVFPVLSDAWVGISEEINAWWQRTVWKDLTEGLGEVVSELAAQFDEMITQPFVNAIAESWQGFADGIQTTWEQSFGLLPAIAEDVGKTIAGPLGKVVEQLSGIKIGGDGGGVVGGLIEQVTGISFQRGTPFVPRTMLAQVHQGEAIIPAAQNPFRGGGGLGDVNINFGNVVLAPGSMQSQAEEFIEIVKRNIRGAGDELRRVVNREG